LFGAGFRRCCHESRRSFSRLSRHNPQYFTHIISFALRSSHPSLKSPNLLGLICSGAKKDCLRHPTALYAPSVTALPFQTTPILRMQYISIPLFPKSLSASRRCREAPARSHPRQDSETSTLLAKGRAKYYPVATKRPVISLNGEVLTM
jgi:hypothetical protein